jgi:hypothetical protein
MARQRAQLARDTSFLGLGYIPKLTKRVLVKCTEIDNDTSLEIQGERCSIQGEPSTRVVMEAFESYLVEKLGGEVDESPKLQQEKAKKLCAEINLLFNQLAPRVLYDNEKYQLDEGEEWVDVLGSKYLMRLLLVIPNILREADLPIRQYDQIISIARELLDFVAKNHNTLFDSSFQLPNEEYEEEPSVPPTLPGRINRACRNPSEAKDRTAGLNDVVDDSVGGEIVQPSDRLDLTDFVSGVMQQTIITRATAEDVNRKNRRVTVGHPCIVCRHCLGRNGEGKYFFGSIESMTTASTVIEKHLLRCPDLNEKVKQEIVNARAKHSEQRKFLPSGAQGAFFARLFDRIRLMRPCDGHDSDVLTTSIVLSDPSHSREYGVSKVDSTSVSSDSPEGYKSHVEVMDFIQSAEPWKNMEPLVENVEKYYNCLEYGGKIVNTNMSPLNFSSEWLYSKIAPQK